MGPLAGIAAAAGLIAYIGFGLGAIDFFFAPQAPVTFVAGNDSPPSGQPAALSHPLHYSAIVCQSGDGMPERKCRYHVPKEIR